MTASDPATPFERALALRAEFGVGIALFMGFSKIAVALGGLPDEIPVHEQPTPDVPVQPARFKRAARRSDSWPMRLAIGVLCLLGLVAPVRADEGPAIGGRTQTEWRHEMAALEREAEAAERDLVACEAREAPAAYDGVDAIITRDRRGRLRGVELTRCDEQRSDLLEVRSATEDFEEAARRSEVPPGWLR